jgi:hypothetical protein
VVTFEQVNTTLFVPNTAAHAAVAVFVSVLLRADGVSGVVNVPAVPFGDSFPPKPVVYDINESGEVDVAPIVQGVAPVAETHFAETRDVIPTTDP